MIDLRDVRKAYGREPVLRGVRLSLPPGQVTGLVGVNGAGKTTLLRCLCGFERYEGEIVAPDDLRARLGYLPTAPPFPSYVTGREYLRLCLQARRLPVPDLDAANAFALPLDDYAAAYSTGMAKKLAFTALMLQRNDVLVLDEPFNGVDLAGNLLLTAALRRLRERGTVILVTSHLLETLTGLCDRVAVLDGGVVARVFDAAEYEGLGDALGQTDVAGALARWKLY